MVARRPGFMRNDTDKPSNSSDGPVNNPEEHELGEVDAKTGAYLDVKDATDFDPAQTQIDGEEGDVEDINAPVTTANDLITQVIHVEDDASMNAITFRTVFLGTGLSIFAAVLQEIFYFKPQTIFVSVVFLTVIAYVLGEFMYFAIPSRGVFRYLNPGPFNRKEHAAITIMASAAAQAATSTEALAAQELFYGGYPSKAAGIFITLSSQLIGFGIAGLLRDVMVYPTNMLWPSNLPVATLLENLHKDKQESKRKLRIFYWVFAFMFCWEVLPEYMFTVLTGVSIFCLADQKNLVFTNLFGGASGNEGLGFLSLCFDWNYIAPFFSPLWYPLQTTINMNIGIFGCYILFMALYYGNIPSWRAKDFPFLSQELFNGTSSNSTNFVVYNQSLILNDNFEIDHAALAQEGIPYLTPTYLGYLITTNMGMLATIVHMMLWNFDDLKAAWEWAYPSNLKRSFRPGWWKFWSELESPDERLARKINDPRLDPHYKLMLRNKYKEVPLYWWAAVLVTSWIVGIACLYVMKSTLPWWGFLLSVGFTTVFMLFFGALNGISGFGYNIQPIAQMLAGYMFPGRPLANFYFTCYTYNAVGQGILLSRDLKLAQYSHLPPMATFWLQVGGAIIGALFNWVMMVTIVKAQAPILTAIQGTNIWSGQNIQQFNTLAIAWSIAPDLFSIGARYQWVTISFLLGIVVPLPLYIMYRVTGNKAWGYLNPSIILWFTGNLFVGINSAFTMTFLIAYFSQFYLRKYRPAFFVKYNYIVSAAMDGGTQVVIFILTFAVAGGSGKAVPFPTWAGTPDPSVHNNDYCMVNPAN